MSRETITVTGDSPVVDIQNNLQRQIMDREVIDTVPTGKSFQSYAPAGARGRSIRTVRYEPQPGRGRHHGPDRGGARHPRRPPQGRDDSPQRHGRQQRLFRGRRADVRSGFRRRHGGNVGRGGRTLRRGAVGGRPGEPGSPGGGQRVQRSLFRGVHRSGAARRQPGRRPCWRAVSEMRRRSTRSGWSTRRSAARSSGTASGSSCRTPRRWPTPSIPMCSRPWTRRRRGTRRIPTSPWPVRTAPSTHP